MQELYRSLAAMSMPELLVLKAQLKFHVDPWAVGARKLIAWEIRSVRHAGKVRNKIVNP